MPVFKDRQNLHLAPIPAKGQRKVKSIWKTADGKPGEYYFYGHVNYRRLYDANTLAEFKRKHS